MISHDTKCSTLIATPLEEYKRIRVIIAVSKVRQSATVVRWLKTEEVSSLCSKVDPIQRQCSDSILDMYDFP